MLPDLIQKKKKASKQICVGLKREKNEIKKILENSSAYKEEEDKCSSSERRESGDFLSVRNSDD